VGAPVKVTGDEDDQMTLLTIGEFARASGLTPKALRLYDDLGLVVPTEVDPNTGYRRYAPEQLGDDTFAVADGTAADAPDTAADHVAAAVEAVGAPDNHTIIVVPLSRGVATIP
jgi:hypothetical protein